MAGRARGGEKGGSPLNLSLKGSSKDRGLDAALRNATLLQGLGGADVLAGVSGGVMEKTFWNCGAKEYFVPSFCMF